MNTNQNLAPAATDGGALTPVMPPSVVCEAIGWKPLLDVDSDFIVTKGTQIGVADNRGSLLYTRTLSSKPLAAMHSGPYKVIIMTADNVHTFSKSLQIDMCSDLKPSSLPRLIAEPATPISIKFPAITLSRSYSPGDIVGRADSSALGQAMISAYEQIDAAAIRTGVFWQPVIARIRAYDDKRRTIFYTEPQLFAHPTLPHLEGYATLQADSVVTEQRIEAPTFSLKLVPPPFDSSYINDFQIFIAGYEVLVTPMLHTFDTTKAPKVLTSQRASDPWQLSVTLAPGLLMQAAPDSRPDLLRRIISRLFYIEAIGASVSGHQAAPGRQPHAVFPKSTQGIPAASAEILRALNVSCKASSTDCAKLSPPHRFSAAQCTSGSTAIVWADIRAMRFNGWPLEAFANTLTGATGPWKASVRIDFADGSFAVSSSQGTRDAPYILNPIISYPDSDAELVTLTVQYRDNTYSAAFQLTADPSGLHSVFVHPSLRPFQLSTPSAAPVALYDVSPPIIHMPSALVLADASAPLLPRAVTEVANSDITAVSTAVFGQSAWDFGRSRFYVFSSRGIHLLNADVSRGSMSLSYLDSHVVADASHVAMTSEGMAALAGDEIIMVAGHKVTHLDRCPGVQGLAWAADSHELWCLRPDHTLVLRLKGMPCRYTMPQVFEPTVVPGVVYDSTNGECCLAGHDGRPDTVPIVWNTSIEPPSSQGARLTIDIAGTFTPLTVSVYRNSTMQQASEPDLRLTLNGTVSWPLKIPLPRHLACRPLTVRLTATATPTSRLFKIYSS